jgi:hypothetical protein
VSQGISMLNICMACCPNEMGYPCAPGDVAREWTHHSLQSKQDNEQA